MVEMGVEQIHIHAAEGIRDRFREITETPSGDDEIKAHDAKGREHTQPAEPLPSVVAVQRAESAVGTLAGFLTDKELGDDQRQSEKEYANQIHDEESPTSVLTGDIWEFPYVTQSDRTACGGHDQTYLGRKSGFTTHYQQSFGIVYNQNEV